MSLAAVMTRVVVAWLVVLCVLAATSPAAAGGAQRTPALAPAPRDALTRALARGDLSEATYALERARSLFRPEAVRREFGDVAPPGPHDATPILRDLAARLQFLSPTDRKTARAILARPTNSGDPLHAYAPGTPTLSACDPTRPLCFHWVTTTRDAASAADVSDTMSTFASVYDLEVGTYGYLPPLSDASSANDGGDGRTDIYLADLGGDRVPVFGYCTTDDPHAAPRSKYAYYDVSAYCVVDQDFANPVFGGIDPADARDVTAAHEFFHAIQFAYDWLEDLWLMEGTAMLMEGQFRPDVDDRVRYLANSALTAPWSPVDRGAFGFEYGAWIYWRFLLEDLGELANPLVIRQVWEDAAAAHVDTDGPGPDTRRSDRYSLQSAVDVLNRRGLSFSTLFATFARVNRDPAAHYIEAAAYHYPAAPRSGAYTLGRRAVTGWQSTRLAHLASRYYTFSPGRNGLVGATLKVAVDLPDLVHSPRAVLLVRFADGTSATRPLHLGAAGNGSRLVSFGRASVRRVILVLTNTSARMICDQGTEYSCTGIGRDDLGTYRYRAVVR
jgi:hypothetical protein